jgi:tRNA G10  N-methylase Trm11
LDDSIVHYSSPNHTNGLRLAIQLILIPTEEKSIHFHMDLAKDRTTVEVLEVDRDFYMKFNPWKKPADDVKRINSFKYVPFDMTIEEFEAKLSQPRFDEKIKRTESTRGLEALEVAEVRPNWFSKIRAKFTKA